MACSPRAVNSSVRDWPSTMCHRTRPATVGTAPASQLLRLPIRRRATAHSGVVRTIIRAMRPRAMLPRPASPTMYLK
ncbi:hypothetical protein D3C73_1326190 [compost metagenome]